MCDAGALCACVSVCGTVKLDQKKDVHIVRSMMQIQRNGAEGLLGPKCRERERVRDALVEI